MHALCCDSQSEKSALPYLNSKKIDGYCNDLLSILLNEPKALDSFLNASNLIQSVLNSGKFNLMEVRRLRNIKAFTTELISKASHDRKGSIKTFTADVQREKGIVKSFSNIKGYGFIESDKKEELFVHYSDIRGKGYRTLLKGERVVFTVIQGKKGRVAKNVSLI